jgi:type II secretory pathway component GspD/PulD (secretin)
MKTTLTLASVLLIGLLAAHTQAQDAPTKAQTGNAQGVAGMAVTNAPAAVESAVPKTPDQSGAQTNQNRQPKPDQAPAADGIQVSFQGANIDMVLQWLSQTTGKSVVKHPQAQCQLTIMSTKKMSTREAINLVYRALALEGFAAVESSNAILIMPEGKEPKLNPELLDPSRKDIPEGRQRLVKFFSLAHIQAAELREKVRGILSDKGTIDLDERANQLIITDYNENLRLFAELIQEFDIPASGLVIEIYAVKHGDAEELGSLLTLILNAQSGGGGAPAKPSRPPSSGVSFSSSGPMPMGGLAPGQQWPPQQRKRPVSRRQLAGLRSASPHLAG